MAVIDDEEETSSDHQHNNISKSTAAIEDGQTKDQLHEIISESTVQKALTQANENSLFTAGDALSVCSCPDHRPSYATPIELLLSPNWYPILMGKFEETVKECTKALELNPAYVKALLTRGEPREKLEQFQESIADMTKILELDQSNDQARRTIIRLKPLADEKREKMKDEMIGKLKEMGNSVLGRFGMSVDNFKAVKDPNTGSYSISFQQQAFL